MVRERRLTVVDDEDPGVRAVEKIAAAAARNVD
jgi:hypothetical protein